jgi:hypothetical protein
MGADTSRIRFDATRDFAGIVLQQGRVFLDADLNEWGAIVDRRLRAETVDLTSFGPQPGHTGSSWVPRHTPDGFRITASAGGLTIGRGRMYVDGLLAENHGRRVADMTPAERAAAGVDHDGFDGLLEEVVGPGPVTYADQPYWPNPTALPTGGTHLVYLDVWEREVTHLEAPDLVEVAVGVDATARRQIVWQVRTLGDVGPNACQAADEDLPTAWRDLIRPAGGRLSVTTAPVDPTDDPCALPPSGGYRGLENQSYRIEIHDGGAPGTATFKWSRDNGSVASPVVEMVSPTVLRLASVGRDDVLRITTGDWVEVLDDHREFDQRSGAMRRVTVDDAARTITFDDPLDADLQPADADEATSRHLRVRRWDQGGTIRTAAGASIADLDAVGATGLITVPATATTQVVLEHGIVVSFDLASEGGRLRTGDHWIVAARTADTSVEELDHAPPLGVHHHYARLATVTFPTSQTDCRRLWPPVATGGGDCGDCTVCVTPESHATGTLTIQMAVDVVRESGGTVCLAVGTYDLAEPVNLDGCRSVRLRGQGLATVLVARGTAITATRAADLVIERLAVVGGTGAQAAVRWEDVVRARLTETGIVSLGARDGTGAALELAGLQLWTTVRDNLLLGQYGLRAGDDELGVLSAALEVSENLIGGGTAVDLGVSSAHVVSCRVTRNEVLAGPGGGIVVPGAGWPGGSLVVSDNVVATEGAGITTSGAARVERNVVTALARQEGGDGIVLISPTFQLPPGDGEVRGNRVEGRGGDGISLRTSVRSLTIADNTVRRAGAGITVAARGRASVLRITDNDLVEISGPTDEDGGELAHAIAVSGADSLAITGNTIDTVGVSFTEGEVAGVLVTACRDVRVEGNAVERIGPQERSVGAAVGVVVLAPFDHVIAQSNVIRWEGAEDQGDAVRWIALLLGRLHGERRREATAGGSGSVRFGARSTVPLDQGAVAFTDGWAARVAVAAGHTTVNGNHLQGGGRYPAGVVRTAGDVTAEGNQCDHGDGGATAMLLEGSTVSAATNRMRGPEVMLVVDTAEDRLAAVGNLASGGTHLGGPGHGLPAPWDPLNPAVH